jgi:pimeloyl-ACP methyl ester carboxylesterase
MNAVLIVLAVLACVAGALVLFTWRTARRVEAALPPQGRFIDVPGARLHVVDRGQGPTVLLIHGLAGQLGHFTYGVVDRLATQYRVVAVDRPGSGYSLRTAGASATLGAQADVMAALIDALQLGRPVVAGHSLGGAVALALALRHPHRVAGLALVAPLTHAPEAAPDAFAGLAINQAWLRRLVAWTLALPAMIAQRDKVLALVFGPEPVPDDFATRGEGLLSVRPSHFIGASTDLAAVAEDLPALEQGYASLQLPVSVLYGRGDRILSPAEQGQTLAAVLPGCRLLLVEGGHMLPVTQPECTADFIAEVVQQTLVAAGASAVTAAAPRSPA